MTELSRFRHHDMLGLVTTATAVKAAHIGSFRSRVHQERSGVVLRKEYSSSAALSRSSMFTLLRERFFS